MTTKASLQTPSLLRLREPEVRALCTGAAFGRGDAWQRAGHVGNPTIYADGFSADVRGTWRQVERVTVSADAKGVHTACSCQVGEYCRHAAALLLHWIRAPRSFADATLEVDGEPAFLDEAPGMPLDPPEVETAGDELAVLLETHAMTNLREIARRRGLRGGGRNKVELAATLAVSLADPENIDAALATLTGDEQAMLQAIDLIEVEANAGSVVGTAYRVLSGGAEPTEFQRTLNTLVNLGLVFTISHWNYPSERYIVPRVVAARIPLSDSPLSRIVRAAERVDQVAPPAGESRLDLVEVFLVVVHEALRGGIGGKLRVLPEGATIVTSSGWMSEQRLSPSSKSLFGRPQSTELTLRPQPPSLSDSDLQYLAERTGGSIDMIDFAMEMLATLEILTYSVHGKSAQPVVREGLLHALLQLSPVDRTVVLTEMWLSLFDAFDFRGMILQGTPLHLHTLQQPFFAPLAMSEPRSSAVRILMTRLLARLSTGDTGARWYDLPAWLDMLWTLTPELLGKGAGPAGEWWFSGTAGNETRLNLEQRQGWQEIWEPLIESILVGPMTWLRVVDTSRQEDGTLSFRPRPEAAMVLQEPPGDAVPLLGPALSLRVDPSSGAPEILVPAGYPDTQLHILLTEIADLADISPDGLRYRLMRQRAQEAFERGVTGPGLLRILADRAGGSVPENVRVVLDAWWKSYGNVRLYDDLTLIEFDDDILLRELLATSSLRGALVDVITPRLVSVEPAAVRSLLGEMERLGYTPRVMEDA
jgi:Helicase conserved C-terminal domain/SWIM zinc finger